MMLLSRRSCLGAVAAAGCLSAVGCTVLPREGEKVSAVTKTAEYVGVNAGRVNVWRGVPIGLDPYASENRYLPPVRFDAGGRAVECLVPGTKPLQPGKAGLEGGGACLQVNVWAPAAKAEKPYPVMVWIPGGGSTRCDNNDPRYNGTAFAEDGVVLVTLNYRVNVDGFIKLTDGAGNIGLRDMIFGLEWVHDHIAAFGGDPACVTVFGQSAGGTHTTSLIASPKAKGLFKRAIVQSGSAVAQWANEGDADWIAKRLADFYGVSPTRAGFNKLSREAYGRFPEFVKKIGADFEWMRRSHGNVSIFKPYVDGEILTDMPVNMIAKGAADGVEVLAGCMREEWRNYMVPDGSIAKVTHRDLERWCAALGVSPDLPEKYRKAGRGETVGDIYCAMQSDLIFRMPVNRLLESLSAGGAKVWAYSNDWRSPVRGASGAILGAAHSNDVPMVFKTESAPQAVKALGNAAPKAMTDLIHASWVRFAKTGNPGWDAFDRDARRTMCFNATSAVKSDPWAFERKALPLTWV